MHCIICDPVTLLQWGGFGSCSLWEAAAVQPEEVQLLPLCAGAVRPAGTASGDRAHHLCRLCGKREGEIKQGGAEAQTKHAWRLRPAGQWLHCPLNKHILSLLCCIQEPTGEKTNNGIHYKLQLLYSSGRCACFTSQGSPTQRSWWCDCVHVQVSGLSRTSMSDSLIPWPNR